MQDEYYRLLDITKNASETEIKKAYRKKALENHPDKGGDPEHFKKINIAYETLSNPEKKMLYDNGVNENSPPDLSNILNGLFRNMGSGIPDIFKNMFQPPKTPPFLYTYKTSLENICKRKIKKLRVSRNIPCPCTNNSKQCMVCQGKGMKSIPRNLGHNMIQVINSPCNNCSGTGKIFIFCDDCKNGIKQSEKTFEIHLSPEIENNYNYIFENQGHHNINMEPGDFIVNIVYEEHPEFKVENKNLIYIKNITLKEALCGFEFEVKHPSGENIVIKTFEITPPNFSRVFKGKGISVNGNLEIRFNIVFPDSLSTEQQEIISKNF